MVIRTRLKPRDWNEWFLVRDSIAQRQLLHNTHVIASPIEVILFNLRGNKHGIAIVIWWYVLDCTHEILEM